MKTSGITNPVSPIHRQVVELKLTGPDGKVKEYQKIVTDSSGKVLENKHIKHGRRNHVD